MEIPSSSPVYTPLKSEDADPHQIYGLEQIELFKEDIDDTNRTQYHHSSSETYIRDNERSDPELNINRDKSSPQDANFQVNQEKFDKSQSQKALPQGTSMGNIKNRVDTGEGQISSSEPETPFSRSPIRFSHAALVDHKVSHHNATEAAESHRQSDDLRSSKIQFTPSFNETPSSDNETTIFSDDDNDQNNFDNDDDDDETLFTQTQETSEGKTSTQNYLEEFLTESVLESLPLPPERKEALRWLRQDNK